MKTKVDIEELRRLIAEAELPSDHGVNQAEWVFCYDMATAPGKISQLLEEIDKLKSEKAKLIEYINTHLGNTVYMDSVDIEALRRKLHDFE